jgi:hypothetical protein
MSGQLVDSSPLSSPTSPIPIPPGAWFTETTPAENMDPLHSTAGSASSSKASAVPLSPSSTKSTASNVSKKRARADVDKDSDSVPEKASKQRKQAQAPKEPVKVSQPTSTRPARARKAPERYVNIDPPAKKPAAPRKAPAGSKIWQPKHVTESSKSRLCKTDVYHMLVKDDCWTSLVVEQKQELFSLLPETPPNKRLLGEVQSGKAASAARPFQFSLNSNEFRTDVAQYLEELSEGYLSPAWLAYAEQAVIQRAEGAFDDWKDEESEAWWGQK